MLWTNFITNEEIDVNNKEIFSIEFKTEMSIVGVGSMRNSNFLIGPTVESLVYGSTNLHTYEIKISHPINVSGPSRSSSRSKNGYYHVNGIPGEMSDLLSLFFHTRIYVTSNSQGELTENSIRSRQVTRVVRGNLPKWYTKHITNSNSKNFVDFVDFLKNIENLPATKHQRFMNAFTNYNLALQQIGISQEMTFVRLVSAIESLSNKLPLDKSENSIDKNKFQTFLSTINDENQKLEFKEIFTARKATQKFIKFIKNYSSEYILERTDIPYGNITDDTVEDILSRIYRARSSYLHAGSAMFISEHWEDGRMDMDSAMGMSIGSKWFSENEKLPTLEFFEGLVRHCIVSYLNESIKN